MNLGNLPGFYYDASKGKYFKIQANHAAPAEAKYAKSNVDREKREAKKRKLEERHDQIVRKQTVPAARLLKSPLLGGSGVRREHGDRPLASYYTSRESAFVKGLQPNDIDLEITGYDSARLSVFDSHYLHDSAQSLLAVSHGPGSHAIYCFDREDWSGKQTLPHRPPLYAFHDSIGVLTQANLQETPYVVACTSRYNNFSGNAFVGRLPLHGQDPRDHPHVASGTYFNVGDSTATVWDCKVSPNSERVAFASTNGAVVCTTGNLAGDVELFSSPNTEAFACDWLDSSTLAVGTRTKHRKNNVHGVQLWDVRTGGSVERFIRNERIVAIQNPNDSGNNLIVASNYKIDLYDTRMISEKLKDRPLLSLDHKSGSTRLHLSTRGTLVAAMDQYNKIQVYSLATGKHLRTFGSTRPGLLQNPRWQQDVRGAIYLQACAKNTIRQWAWNGCGWDGEL